ncbi:MAG: hypothetical protein RL701_6719 [Pseudomonadota bacterium]
MFAVDKAGELTFHAAEPPKDAEVILLVGNIRRRILRHVERRGLLDADCQDDDPLATPMCAIANEVASPAPRSCGELASESSASRPLAIYLLSDIIAPS